MKIICVGRNYTGHIKELRNEPENEPVLFLKPDTALIPRRHPFYLPSFSKEVHYEAELVLRISKVGKNIAPEFASRYYDQITVGLDFTARDIQQEMKMRGLPWEKAKAFDHSAAVGEMLQLKDLKNPKVVKFSLKVNGKQKQSAGSDEMIFGFNDLIAYISRFFTLKIGDLIFTGTPSGVGKLSIDDQLELYLEEKQVLKLNVK